MRIWIMLFIKRGSSEAVDQQKLLHKAMCIGLNL